jgi:hypothetical protein
MEQSRLPLRPCIGSSLRTVISIQDQFLSSRVRLAQPDLRSVRSATGKAGDRISADQGLCGGPKTYAVLSLLFVGCVEVEYVSLIPLLRYFDGCFCVLKDRIAQLTFVLGNLARYRVCK